MKTVTPIAAVIAIALVGCKADKVTSRAGETEDAGAVELLPAPVLQNLPETTPNDTVAIRGTSEGKRVVVQGGPDGTRITSILPGGSFCTDLSLESGAPTSLTIYAMGDGLLSEPAQIVVTKDATAPAPASPTCSGASPSECVSTELCGNELDDNCDGWIDNCDLGCSGCVDDALEPNDFAINVPIVGAGVYELSICPCREDWFAFQRNAFQRIKVTADFTHATLPINLRLYKADANGEQGDFVIGSFSTTDQEVIDEVVDSAGLYYLRVYPFGTDSENSSGSYTLTIQ